MTHSPLDNYDQTISMAAQPEVSSPALTDLRVGILGGGTAGATIAIRLAALGIKTTLLERKNSLIDGPPMCHLHAGGNLYREIADEHCIALLRQSIDMIRMYPHSIDVRPTVLAVPTHDNNVPDNLRPRLDKLTQVYKALIEQDANNKVLGEPEDYYRLYSYERMCELASKAHVAKPQTHDEWMICAAKHLDLEKLKYPIISVQEYGWNIFRLSASAQLALAQYDNACVLTNTNVQQIRSISRNENANKKLAVAWAVEYKTNDSETSKTIEVDFLINACGFQTGIIDDKIGVNIKRMVEFKASFLSYWDGAGGQIPEIVIYGTRGTPDGMAQLTPYPNGYFQIHGMTNEITLFNDGRVDSNNKSAQPELPSKYLSYIIDGWEQTELQARNQKAIDYVAKFIPSFETATTQNNALYGGQQIPGDDDSLRIADIGLYSHISYARAENVKASSTLFAADEIVNEFTKLGLVSSTPQHQAQRLNHQWAYLAHTSDSTITQIASLRAKERGFPIAMAFLNNPINLIS